MTRSENCWSLDGWFSYFRTRLLGPEVSRQMTIWLEVIWYTHILRRVFRAESHLWHFHLEAVSSLNCTWEIAVSKIISLLPILNQIFKHMCLHTHTHTHTHTVLMSTQKYRAEREEPLGKCSNRCINPQYFPGSLKLALILIVH